MKTCQQSPVAGLQPIFTNLEVVLSDFYQRKLSGMTGVTSEVLISLGRTRVSRKIFGFH